MIPLNTYTTSDLIYLLRRQFPTGVTTFSKCPNCGRGSRGGGHCQYCLADELRNRVDGKMVDSLVNAIAAHRDATLLVDELTKLVMEQSDEGRRAVKTYTGGKPHYVGEAS